MACIQYVVMMHLSEETLNRTGIDKQKALRRDCISMSRNRDLMRLLTLTIIF